MEETSTSKPSKYSVELRQSAKREWYIGSVRVTADTKEELKESLNEAVKIATQKAEEVETIAKSEIKRIKF